MSNIILSFVRKITGTTLSYRNDTSFESAKKEDRSVIPGYSIIDYENALTLFGVKVSENCRNRILNTLKTNMLSLSKGSSLSFNGDSKTNTAEEILANIIKLNMLDDNTVLDFEKKVFSLRYFFNQEPVPFSINLKNIINEFIENENYKRIIVENERLHSLEFARLMSDLSESSKQQGLIEKKISSSFVDLKNAYCNNEKYVNIAWIRYINFSASVASNIPQALLDYITVENYRSLFNLLKTKFNKPTKKEADNTYDFAVSICKKILDDIAPNDIPAVLMLGHLAEGYEMYETARSYYAKAANDFDSFNAAMSLINSYENEIKDLLQQKYNEKSRNADFYGERIREANSELSKLYQTWENKLHTKYQNCDSQKAAEEFTSILAKHARYEKNRKNFNESYAILTRAFNLLPESYRIYSEFGLLYQTPGTKYRSNKYYNPENAVKMFLKSLELIQIQIDEKDIKRVKKSVLVPLANTYFMLKKYDEAMEVCNSVLSIDSHENNALKLLRMIHETKFAA